MLFSSSLLRTKAITARLWGLLPSSIHIHWQFGSDLDWSDTNQNALLFFTFIQDETVYKPAL
jgi:hypothetical protein